MKNYLVKISVAAMIVFQSLIVPSQAGAQSVPVSNGSSVGQIQGDAAVLSHGDITLADGTVVPANDIKAIHFQAPADRAGEVLDTIRQQHPGIVIGFASDNETALDIVDQEIAQKVKSGQDPKLVSVALETELNPEQKLEPLRKPNSVAEKAMKTLNWVMFLGGNSWGMGCWIMASQAGAFSSTTAVAQILVSLGFAATLGRNQALRGNITNKIAENLPIERWLNRVKGLKNMSETSKKAITKFVSDMSFTSSLVALRMAVFLATGAGGAIKIPDWIATGHFSKAALTTVILGFGFSALGFGASQLMAKIKEGYEKGKYSSKDYALFEVINRGQGGLADVATQTANLMQPDTPMGMLGWGVIFVWGGVCALANLLSEKTTRLILNTRDVVPLYSKNAWDFTKDMMTRDIFASLKSSAGGGLRCQAIFAN